MKKVKTQSDGIFERIESCSEKVEEILRRLDALGFTAPKQKPATSLKVIQGGLKS